MRTNCLRGHHAIKSGKSALVNRETVIEKLSEALNFAPMLPARTPGIGRLKDKVIVIIGGTSGMGLSAALACINEGARIVVTGKEESTAESAQDAFPPTDTHVLVCDATDHESAEHAIQAAVNAFGRFDGLYHVAGGSGRKWGDGPLHEITPDAWSQTLELNLSSVFYSNRAAIRHFLETKTRGSILNMASVLGFSPSPGFFATHAYATAKAAIIGMTTSSAAYYASSNIRINAVAPALVETPMAQRAATDPAIQQFIRSKQPLDGGRIGKAQDLDGAVVFLLSDESRFMTGQVLAIDGGWSVSDGTIGPGSG